MAPPTGSERRNGESEKRDRLNRLPVLRAVLLLSVIGALAWLLPRQRLQGTKPPPTGPGVAIAYGLGRTSELSELGSAWYLDYDYRGELLGGRQRFFMVKTTRELAGVAQVARSSPGEWWQFGNEPNDLHQDNVSPSEYARRYHSFYVTLQSVDPTARVVPAGLANADWRWAESFREAYERAYGTPPPVDGWNIHNYLLETCESATDVELFQRRIEEFRAWMARSGEGVKPLFLTEYGVLYGNGCCGCPAIANGRVIDFMRSTSRWLSETHLVQGWAWFAAQTGGRYNGDLVDADGTLTEFGRAYRDLARELAGVK